jgi:hypothetical protein
MVVEIELSDRALLAGMTGMDRGGGVVFSEEDAVGVDFTCLPIWMKCSHLKHLASAKNV